MKRSEALYIICYVAYIVVFYTFVEIYYKPRVMWLLCPFIALGAFIATIIKNNHSLKNVMLRLAIIIIFSVAAIASSKPQILVCAAMICGADTTSFRRICITSFFTCISVVIITMVLNTVGILPDGNFSRFGVQIKTFGFGYYSIVSYTFFYMVLIYLYLKYDKKKKATCGELLVILGINYILYRLTTVRLTYYLIYPTLLLYLILIKFGLFDLRNKIINFLTVFVFPLLFAFSIWSNYAFTYGNPTFFQVNSLLSNRLALGHAALQRYSVNFLGQYIETNNGETSEYFYIDCGFLFSILGYGLIFTVVLLIIYTYMHNYSARFNNKMLFIWLTVLAGFNIINDTWLSIPYNPISLIFFIILKEAKQKEQISRRYSHRFVRKSTTDLDEPVYDKGLSR